MNTKKIEGEGLLVVQATPEDKRSQSWVDVERKSIQRVWSLSQLNATRNLHGMCPWPHVDQTLALPRQWQEFLCVSVDLQVPIHLCEEIIERCLSSKVSAARIFFSSGK